MLSLQDRVGVQLLAGLVRLDVDIDAVAEADERRLELRLEILRRELEADFEVRFRVASVGMEMDRVGHDARAGAKQPRRVGAEEVGVSAHFMNRPQRRLIVEQDGGQRIRFAVLFGVAQDARRPNHVMEDIAAADRRTAGAVLGVDVVDFLHLDRRDVAILGESGRDARNLAPPVGRVPLHFEFVGLDDQVGGANRPDVAIGEHARRRHVGGIPARRAAVGPFRDLGDFGVAQRRVVLKFLDADVLLDIPGRHHAGVRADAGPLLDGARVRPHLFIRRQRHRRDAVGPVTVLTAPLKNGGDIFRERDFALAAARTAP